MFIDDKNIHNSRAQNDVQFKIITLENYIRVTYISLTYITFFDRLSLSSKTIIPYIPNSH